MLLTAWMRLFHWISDTLCALALLVSISDGQCKGRVVTLLSPLGLALATVPSVTTSFALRGDGLKDMGPLPARRVEHEQLGSEFAQHRDVSPRNLGAKSPFGPASALREGREASCVWGLNFRRLRHAIVICDCEREG